MKKILLRTGLLPCLMLCSSIAQAIAIDVPGYNFGAIASSLDSSTGTFNANGAGNLAANLTDNEAVSWGMGTSNDASLSLSFNTTVYDGAGTDLSIFYVGSGSHTTNITLFDGATSSTKNFLNLSPSYTGSCVEVNQTAGCTGIDQGIFVLNIDFADFVNLQGGNFLGNNALQQIRLDIGNGLAIPSLVGAYHITAVPLPLPILLFTSGLALLGYTGRRSTAAT